MNDMILLNKDWSRLAQILTNPIQLVVQQKHLEIKRYSFQFLWLKHNTLWQIAKNKSANLQNPWTLWKLPKERCYSFFVIFLPSCWDTVRNVWQVSHSRRCRRPSGNSHTHSGASDAPQGVRRVCTYITLSQQHLMAIHWKCLGKTED